MSHSQQDLLQQELKGLHQSKVKLVCGLCGKYREDVVSFRGLFAPTVMTLPPKCEEGVFLGHTGDKTGANTPICTKFIKRKHWQK